jgi:RimJ/RimL family protein N-acetyltransferase
MRKLFLGLFLLLSQVVFAETILTERLEITPLKPSDWGVFLEINANKQVLQNANVNVGDDPNAFFRPWFEWLVAGNGDFQAGRQTQGMGFLIKTRSGEAIGTMMCDQMPNGYWETTTVLAPKYWKSGYGTEARTAMLPFYFNTLNVKGLVATIATDNIGSTKITQSLGYKMTAVDVQRGSLTLDRKRKWNQYTLTAQAYRQNQPPCRFHGLAPKPQEEN